MKPKLESLSLQNYSKLLNRGMFWEYYPEATGIYYEDVQLGKEKYARHQDKLKEEELSNMKHQWTEDGLTCKQEWRIEN